MAKRPSGLGRGLGSLIPGSAAGSATAATIVSNRSSMNDGVPTANGIPLSVPIDRIEANPDQPRVAFRHSELEDLTNSIKEHGILQPLTVQDKGDGTYELIAGERRLRASKLAGLKEVPVFLRKAENQERLVLALIENIQREDLNPVEEATAYRRMAEEFGMTQEDIAKQVGKGRSTIANSVRLLDLPAEIKEAIAEGAVAAGTARAILRLKDDKSRMAFFRKLMDTNMTTRQAEAGTRKMSGAKIKAKSSRSGTDGDPAITSAEERIRNGLGVKTEIRLENGQGTITLRFFSAEEMEDIVRKLENC